MKISIISVTEKGRMLSMKLCSALSGGHEVSRYCYRKYSDSSSVPFDSIYDVTAELFGKSGALVFISACGIAVRAAAPHISSKLTDPAVIAADDCGKFVIPLLSGHIGGANRLAVIIAEAIGAVPVITTATDTGGRFSPDSFAAANSLIVTDMQTAKEMAAAVLNGERIGLESEYECVNIPEDISPGENCRAGLYIGTDCTKQPFELTLRLVPRNIILGIGCKRGTSAEKISRCVSGTFFRHGIDVRRICGAATIDVKADEAGLIAYCRNIGAELFTYTAEELMAVTGEFSGSDFVLKTVGADNVCERSAVLCSGGRLVIPKCSNDGVTAAAAEKNIILDFAKEIL